MSVTQTQGRKPTTMSIQFTPTEQKIIDILQDGRPHHRSELRDALDGEFTALVNVQNHLSRIRKKIQPMGQDIVCELVNRRICYRQVRLLASPYN